MLQFFIDLNHPASAWPFLRSMISINTIRDRKSPSRINDWMMDSGGSPSSLHMVDGEPALNNCADESIAGRTIGNLVAAVTLWSFGPTGITKAEQGRGGPRNNDQKITQIHNLFAPHLPYYRT
jgi:hypothetical protein